MNPLRRFWFLFLSHTHTPCFVSLSLSLFFMLFRTYNTYILWTCFLLWSDGENCYRWWAICLWLVRCSVYLFFVIFVFFFSSFKQKTSSFSLSLSLFYNLGSSIRTQTHKYPTPSPEAHDLLFFPMRGRSGFTFFFLLLIKKQTGKQNKTKQNLVKLIMVSFVCFFLFVFVYFIHEYR